MENQTRRTAAHEAQYQNGYEDGTRSYQCGRFTADMLENHSESYVEGFCDGYSHAGDREASQVRTAAS